MKALQSMVRAALALTAALAFAGAQAQMTPVGNWQTHDEKTGEIKSLIVINEANGVLNGHIEKLLRKDVDQNEVCNECRDERKGKRMLGLEIIRGAKKTDGKDVWEGGKVLDPENGKEYTLRLTPIEGGKKLEVRGYIGFFFRNQTWVRVP